jgi:hypothetical protein
MRPSLIIPRLKAQVAALSNRVAAAATVEAAMDQTNLGVPNAFIVPGPDVVEGDVLLSPYAQEITARFSVVLTVANTAAGDDRGQAAVEALLDLRNTVMTALVGWTPDAARFAPLSYGGGDEIVHTRARAHTQLEFFTSTTTANAA